MTRSELVKKLKDRYDNLYIKDVETIVARILSEVSKSLIRGDRVELRGFGSFSTRLRKPRMARNPKTGSKVQLGTRRAVYFRPGKELRDRVNK